MRTIEELQILREEYGDSPCDVTTLVDELIETKKKLEKAELQPKSTFPTVVMHEGGPWLAALRTWIQSNVHYLDNLLWGSEVPNQTTPRKLEYAAATAVAADRADRSNNGTSHNELITQVRGAGEKIRMLSDERNDYRERLVRVQEGLTEARDECGRLYDQHKIDTDRIEFLEAEAGMSKDRFNRLSSRLADSERLAADLSAGSNIPVFKAVNHKLKEQVENLKADLETCMDDANRSRDIIYAMSEALQPEPGEHNIEVAKRRMNDLAYYQGQAITLEAVKSMLFPPSNTTKLRDVLNRAAQAFCK